MSTEAERKTRRDRINPKLDLAGWPAVVSYRPGHGPCRTDELPTDDGPADYGLWFNDKVIGLVEAKRVARGAQGDLTQAERYARGLRHTGYDFGGCGCPFIYSTNGERIWFRDVRHPLNLSREIAAFHTPEALRDLLARDFDRECETLLRTPNTHHILRPYQRECNEALELAIAQRHRNLLVAMATGTGKTLTMVNQIYRLMKSRVARRVLFLVDRRALAVQAVRAFASFEAEPGRKFDQVYEVYSSRFQQGDFAMVGAVSTAAVLPPPFPPQLTLTPPGATMGASRHTAPTPANGGHYDTTRCGCVPPRR